jgi:hypothetical protein
MRSKGLGELSILARSRASSYTTVPPSTLTMLSFSIVKVCPLTARGARGPLPLQARNCPSLTGLRGIMALGVRKVLGRR